MALIVERAGPGGLAIDRNLSVDLTKLAAAFMVVGLHANFLSDVSVLGSLATVNGLFRLAVPFFFLVSGYYFFRAEQSGRAGKWVRRMLALHVVWMVVYTPFWLVVPMYKGESWATIALTAVFGYYHLWYTMAVALAALVTIAALRLGLRGLLVAAVGCFILGACIQYAVSYADIPSGLMFPASQGWLHRNFLLFAFPFFAIGYLIAAAGAPARVGRTTMVLLLGVSILALAAEVYANYLASGAVRSIDIYGVLIVAAPASLIVVLQSSWRSPGGEVSRLAEALFFCHILVLKVVTEFFHFGSLWLAPVCLVLSLLLSVGVMWIDRRVPRLLL